MEYNICSNWARSNFSGGIDGRPVWEYISSKRDDMLHSAKSAIARMAYGPKTGPDWIQDSSIPQKYVRRNSGICKVECRSRSWGSIFLLAVCELCTMPNFCEKRAADDQSRKVGGGYG